MANNDSFIATIEQTIRSNWNKDALTDYKGNTLRFDDVARKIEKIHIVFKLAGIRPGDKISICGRNSAHWVVTFLGVVTYGAVAVPILHEFKADNIHNIVNHSESRMLFVGDQIWENLNENDMPQLEGIVEMKNFDIVISRSEQLTYAREHLNEEFGKRFPCRFRAEDVKYRRENPNELAIINYTSGTTGYSKGVMLSYRGVLSSLGHLQSKVELQPGDNIVSMLPLGHIFGLVFEFLLGFMAGAHIWFLTRMPSPRIIMESFAIIRPRLVCCVPLVIEKIFKKEVLPKVDNKLGKLLLHLPIISDKIKGQIRNKAMEIFGGNFIQIIVGGAPFNAEVESFLRKINFPYTMAYGMTECSPLVCNSRWDELIFGSCGKTVANMETRILSSDPEHIPGELICKGENLMLGYYKDPEATAKTIDKDGWLHTGDMAIKDKDGYVFIKGRCKNMLLTASGQNIYPEEIEARLNNMLLVNESLILLSGTKLIALVYPDNEEATAQGLTPQQLNDALEANRVELNKSLPAYSQITQLKIYPEEFEKTAKKSIKRFLYQDIKG